MKKLLLISSVVFLIAGFGAKSQDTYVSANQPSEVTQISQESTSSSANTSVELIDAGAEPRRELRFTPAVNATQTVSMTLGVGITMFIKGQAPPPIVDTPPVELKMETEVTQVDDNGDIYIDFSYSEVNVVANPNTPPELVNAMRSQLEKLVGFQGSIIVDAQGNTKDIYFDLPEGLDPITKQMLEQMSSSLKQISSPLPPEAIGVGAKWQVLNSLTINGMTINQTATYELVSLEDDIATLAVAIKQDAAAQTITPPGFPPSEAIQLESLDSEGQATITIGLTQIMPISAIMSLDSNTQMKITEPKSGQEIRMGMNLLMDMNLESQ